MPNIRSAMKRMRTSDKRRACNRAVRTRTSSSRRRVVEAVASGDRTKSEEAVRNYFSELDKAVKKGVIKQNNAGRRKARAARRLAAMDR